MIPGLKQHPKVDLGLDATPIQRLSRLGEELGVDLWVKRDDCTSLTFGGNKVRQLEYYLGPAAEQGADIVVITGAVQSNFVRTCAAAARTLGMDALVQLEDRVPKNDTNYRESGNVLLNKMFGADIRYFPEGEDEAAADANLDKLADELKAEGRNPYVVHLGLEHAPIGALGYCNAAVESKAQMEEMGSLPDHVVIPTGSGLTHSGFLVGARAIGWDLPIHAICVRRNADLQRDRITTRCAETLKLLDGDFSISSDDIKIYDDVLFPGYGQMNEHVQEAITLAAHLEGLLVDPVYSGRALAGLIKLVRDGVIQPGERLLFIHTGGLPALFAYQNDLVS